MAENDQDNLEFEYVTLKPILQEVALKVPSPELVEEIIIWTL